MSLPSTIQSIVDIIGYGPTMSIVAEMGGREIRIPAKRAGDVWESIVEIIGMSAAKRLHERFAGTELYIALCTNAIRSDRNGRMIKRYESLLKQGYSARGAVDILTQEFRPISNRTVENIINQPAPAMEEMVQQGQLF